ncbi:LAMI_0F13608g1_1 [Lachancea mirantina]|uniref:LAMI_0F13608g1_1 n=1 Tax=Lachancea mirantina TaxID=1230905 RepID=A0A1G4K3F0_9SACH|nr:LAMI_0F13608g1_1 [Lachancea mirantina]
MEPNSEEEAFFRVISENMKYAFNSPLPTTTQFPTPYSQAQIHLDAADASTDAAGASRDVSRDSSGPLPENRTNAGPGGGSGAGAAGSAAGLADMSVHPSSVLLNGEFLLNSPEQFKDFLFDSPAGLNLMHKTPAKTPLRFFNGSAHSSGKGSSLQFQNTLQPPAIQQQATPLRNIDVNLMFNPRNKASSTSPSKRYLSLTPYGKRVLTDIGTPYTRMLASSNSALVDFQRARKDVSQVLQTPQPAKKRRESTTTDNDDPELEEYGSSPTTIQLNSSVTKSARDKLGPIGNRARGRESGSVANCSVSQSSLKSHETNIDERLFELEKLPLSPTPKPSSFEMDVTALKIPELPKMGSFRSERSASTPTIAGATTTVGSSGNHTNKKTSRRQPKFQIIVTDATSFNSAKGTVMGGEGAMRRRKPVLKRSQSEMVMSSNANNAGSRPKRQKTVPNTCENASEDGT